MAIALAVTDSHGTRSQLESLPGAEMLRAVDSIQLTTRHPVATPASWQPGEDVMLSLMVSDDEAKALYGDFKAPKPYIRIIPQPS